ncbi:MAG: phosphate signaling complex protein PhoU [Ruminococcaceae bacterium]|nr:phosphate signaling complex protein PhoU [Oscillospiraceae bacterium]
MRNRLDAEMDRLHNLLLEMGAMCESAIACSIKALLEGDRANAQRAVELEIDINQHEKDIEELCYKLLLRQQPVARDLRKISAALKMVTDMERIGDQAADIAEIALLGNATKADGTLTTREMSLAAIGMVNDAIDAYVQQDLALAHKVIADDDTVDDLFNKAKQELAIMLISQPGEAECVIDLLMVAKYLERIADHAVNIAEWVVFTVTGEYYKDETVQGGTHGPDLHG